MTAGSVEPRSPRVVVVGGGITGLAAAHRLTAGAPDDRRRPQILLVESAPKLGGKITTLDLDDGISVEGGPDSFVVRKPWALELCRALGLETSLIHPATSRAMLWVRDRLLPYPERTAFGVPSDVDRLLRWPGMSFRGRLRATADLYRRPRKDAPDESIGSLARRRLGDECARVLVGPLLAGISSGDAERLSVRATFPEVAGWEQAYGSLIRGAKASIQAGAASGPRPMFATPHGGMRVLVEALARAVGPDRIETSTAVDRIERSGARAYVLAMHGPHGARSIGADAVLVTTPAFEASRLLRPLVPAAADRLDQIPYGSSAVIALGYPPGSAPVLPEASGLITCDDRTITACTWVSRKWPDEAFGDRAVLRAFVGRAGNEAILERSDPEIVADVVHGLARIAPIGMAPDAAAIARWERSMPQYEVGHLERVDALEAALAGATPGLFVAGSAYRGVGIADCVRQAGVAVDRVLRHLAGGAGGAPDPGGSSGETDRPFVEAT